MKLVKKNLKETFAIYKFLNFITKKFVKEAKFLCFWAFNKLKYTWVYIKMSKN